MGSENADDEASAGDRRAPQVADALTLYLWRVPADQVARRVGAARLPAGAMTVAEALLSLLAFALFWHGRYGFGLIVAVPVMILSTAGYAPGRRSQRLKQMVSLLFPLLWWWAWAHGLAAWGRPLPPVYATMVLAIVIGGAIAIFAIEQLSLHRFGLEIHAWRPLDTRFKLVSAGRNTNLAIFAVALLVRRPDSGLVLVAWWTLISLIVHAVRLAQITERQARGQAIGSWLSP